jgi:putative endonuclease
MHADKGRQAEADAAAYLQQQGLTILARNYRCKAGEIDLIARHDNTLIFIEVRSRKSAQFGGAAASITPQKQRKLLLTAQHYLLSYRKPPPCRFDAILFDGGKITWLKNCIHA